MEAGVTYLHRSSDSYLLDLLSRRAKLKLVTIIGCNVFYYWLVYYLFSDIKLVK